MTNLNIKIFIYTLLGLSALLWFLFSFLAGLNLSNFWDFLKILPNVATVDLLIVAVFIKWAWQWKIFKGWLVPFPNLNGTWQGYIHSDWVNEETGEKPPPIPTILTIRQSFGKISCVLRTTEMISYSYVEGFSIDPDKQVKQLVYTYTSKPKSSVKERSSPHDGTIVFEIIDIPNVKLKGRYWTDRETTGEIILTFREKTLLGEVPEDLGPHPVS